MEIIQDDAKKLVQVWLSRKESGDEALQNQLKPMYAQWKQQKYMVAVFHSGQEDGKLGTLKIWREGLIFPAFFLFLSCNKQNLVLQYYL